MKNAFFKKIVFILLLISSGSFALYFAYKAIKQIYLYSLLDKNTEININDYKVINLPDEKFAIKAFYEFYDNNTLVKGSYIIKNNFLNIFTIEDEVQKLNNTKWYVWYSSSGPSYSSLEKKFPIKLSFRALFAVGIFIYFFVLMNFFEKKGYC